MSALRASRPRDTSSAIRRLPLRARLLAGGALFALTVPATFAANLSEAWRAAREHDLELSVARASSLVGEARRHQAGTLWRPYVQATGTAGIASNNVTMTGANFSAPGLGTMSGVNFNTSVNGGASYRIAVAARQPVYNRERDAQKKQLELAADASDLEWQAAQQALMLRTAERYLDVAVASDSVRVLKRQQKAAESALSEARDRYRLGDAPVTDTLEAQARARAVGAQLLAAQSELTVREAMLADVTGLPLAGAQVNTPAEVAPVSPRGTVEQALAAASGGNLMLRMQRAAVDAANQEARKFELTSSPTADVVAQVQRDLLSGTGDFGTASVSSTLGMVGLQLTVPLYTGGSRDARHVEALRLADKASAQFKLAQQQVALQTRSAWIGLSVGVERIAALSDALAAARERLDATRLGHEVGDRTTLDLLNAQNDLAQAELTLTQARAAQIVGQLRLGVLLGTLSEADVQTTDAALAPAVIKD